MHKDCNLHTLAALVKNESGVLFKIAGLFARRVFNIDSLAVGKTEDPGISRMTIVVQADDQTIEQVVKQLNKLIEVIRVSDLTKDDHVERELALLKVCATKENRSEIVELVDIFRAKIVDVGKTSLTIEITGSSKKVSAMEEMLTTFGIKEIARTGKVALARGSKSVNVH
jgi:acetolactate synthase-1/3 small subunit